MKEAFFVGVGGFIGAIARFYVSKLAQIVWPAAAGTFIANILGCLFLGFLIVIFEKSNSSMLYRFLAVGICGSFTTFSTFSAETVAMFRSGDKFLAMTYVIASIIFGLSAIIAGRWVATQFIS